MHRNTMASSTSSGSTLRTARWVSIARSTGIWRPASTSASDRSSSGPRSKRVQSSVMGRTYAPR